MPINRHTLSEGDEPMKQYKCKHWMMSARAGLLVCGLAMGSAAQANITFEFDYSANAAGVGFLDASYGAVRKAALTDAGNRFSDMFGSFFSNIATIQLSVSSFDNANTNTLAYAGTSYSYPLSSKSTGGFVLTEITKSKLQSGVDRNGSQSDATLNVNWGYAWDIDPNVNNTSQFDFYSVINHELTHTLGFGSTIDSTGADLFGVGLSQPGLWNSFDQFLTDGNGNAVIDHGTHLTNQTTWAQASVGGSSLYFNGANAVAANGGNLVGLYSPTTWQDGSSASHLDTVAAAYSGMMMTHSIGPGVEERGYSAVEVGILTDLGYTRIAPVPEPESYAMLLAGLGLLGFVRARTRGRALGCPAAQRAISPNGLL